MFNSNLETKHIKILKQLFQESNTSFKNPIIGERKYCQID